MSTHNYSELFSSYEVEMLQDMDNAITKSELWDWMKTYEPEEGKGFMFSNHPNLDIIQKNMNYGGHSGASYGWTMRTMQELAKKGWKDFRLEHLAYKRIKDTKEYKHAEDLYDECIRKKNKGAHWYKEDMDRMIKREAERIELDEHLEKMITKDVQEWFESKTGSVCSCRKAKGLTSGWCGVAGGGVPACDH